MYVNFLSFIFLASWPWRCQPHSSNQEMPETSCEPFLQLRLAEPLSWGNPPLIASPGAFDSLAKYAKLSFRKTETPHGRASFSEGFGIACAHDQIKGTNVLQTPWDILELKCTFVALQSYFGCTKTETNLACWIRTNGTQSAKSLCIKFCKTTQGLTEWLFDLKLQMSSLFHPPTMPYSERTLQSVPVIPKVPPDRLSHQVPPNKRVFLKRTPRWLKLSWKTWNCSPGSRRRVYFFFDIWLS